MAKHFFRSRNQSFTLIELLIVVAIIGILAALIIVSVTTASAKARDVKRQEDLKNVQKALEMYYTSNGSYPIALDSANGGSDWGNCSGRGSHPLSGSNGWVPNLAPTYIPSLPVDPRQGIDCAGSALSTACYAYVSDGTNYKLSAKYTVETTVPTPTNALQNFYDPIVGTQGSPWDCTYTLYTPGAENW